MPVAPAGWRVLADAAGRPPAEPLRDRRRAAVTFAASSAAALAVLVAGAGFVSDRAAREEAVRDARQTADLLAEAVVEPALTDGLLAGDRADYRRLDGVLRQRVLGGPRVRVKLWTPDGTVLYSDEPALVGTRHRLGPRQRESLAEDRTEATLAPMDDAEHRYEAAEGDLLEVYRPVRTPSGQPLLFEVYSRAETLEARQREVWLMFAPITLVALLLFQLCQLPLVSGLVRRLRAGQQEREWLLQRAVDASDAERRRIAGALHDSVVQQLTGASYVVAGAVRVVADAGQPVVAARLEAAASELRLGIRGFRSLLREVYPPSVAASGLGPALADLVAPLRAQGVAVDVEVPDDAAVPAEVETVLFRVAQECLRNTTRHAGATAVTVAVRASPGRVSLLVTDDGRGFVPEDVLDRRDGHLGLQVLRDLALRAGGRLELASAPGAGTAVRLEVAQP